MGLTSDGRNPTLNATVGSYLKDLRERLGLGVREVQKASALIAAEEENPEFYISAARLSQLENENSPPSVQKVFSISAIYGLDFLDLLKRYGVDADRINRYRESFKLDATHPVALQVYSPATLVTLPVRMDPSFRWETTQLLNRVVAQWGKMPAILLQELKPRTQIYGYVGMNDFTMYPILRPGAFVLVDGDRRRVVQTGWQNESERPIYFIEMRDSYRCAWCQIAGSQITLIPHPMSRVAAESHRYPDEAEIVGQIIGVAMRIVESDSAEAPAG